MEPWRRFAERCDGILTEVVAQTPDHAIQKTCQNPADRLPFQATRAGAEVVMMEYGVGLRRSLLIVAMIAVLGWTPARSQSQNQVPVPTIRVSTHLVLVDVVVNDKQGKPITGLKA